MSFLSKQFIDVIHWTEPEDGILAYRYPMQDMEIQNGGKLTVRDSQWALFVNEGRVADVFGPGLYTLNTQTLPHPHLPDELGQGVQVAVQVRRLLLLHAHADRISTGARRIRSRFATRNSARFACAASAFTPITSSIAKKFYTKISGTRDIYRVADLEGQLRNTIIGANDRRLRRRARCRSSTWPRIRCELAQKIAEHSAPAFADSASRSTPSSSKISRCPTSCRRVLDQRISMNMIGDMGKYTQYQVAQSIPIAAANEGGGAVGIGAGLGAGMAMANHDGRNAGQTAAAAQPRPAPPQQPPPAPAAPAARHKVLLRVRQPNPASGEVLPRVRQAPGVISTITIELSGLEWVIEAYGCTRWRAGRTRRRCARLFDEIIAEMICAPSAKRSGIKFPRTGGITGLCLLAESHLACHTFPEHRLAVPESFLLRAAPRMGISTAASKREFRRGATCAYGGSERPLSTA